MPKKKIDPEKYYSMLEAIEYVPIKSRETFARYVNRYQGETWAIGKVKVKYIDQEKGATAKRYVISGEWLQEFNKRYKSGELRKSFMFKTEQLRMTLADIKKYCEKNNIKTVAEFVAKIKKEQNEPAESRF